MLGNSYYRWLCEQRQRAAANNPMAQALARVNFLRAQQNPPLHPLAPDAAGGLIPGLLPEIMRLDLEEFNEHTRHLSMDSGGVVTSILRVNAARASLAHPLPPLPLGPDRRVIGLLQAACEVGMDASTPFLRERCVFGGGILQSISVVNNVRASQAPPLPPLSLDQDLQHCAGLLESALALDIEDSTLFLKTLGCASGGRVHSESLVALARARWTPPLSPLVRGVDGRAQNLLASSVDVDLHRATRFLRELYLRSVLFGEKKEADLHEAPMP
jgi:hypothetical protein